MNVLLQLSQPPPQRPAPAPASIVAHARPAPAWRPRSLQMARGRQCRPRHCEELIVISLRCASSPSPPCEWRRSRGGVSFGSHGISGFDCLSHCPTHSPVSPLSGNIDSLPGQVALALPLLRDGARALQFRHVREKPARSLRPLTSHGARARHPRLSQVAIASDDHPAVRAQPVSHPQRLGAAARRPVAPMDPC